jgi:hypothetical protein
MRTPITRVCRTPNAPLARLRCLLSLLQPLTPFIYSSCVGHVQMIDLASAKRRNATPPTGGGNVDQSNIRSISFRTTNYLELFNTAAVHMQTVDGNQCARGRQHPRHNGTQSLCAGVSSISWAQRVVRWIRGHLGSGNRVHQHRQRNTSAYQHFHRVCTRGVRHFLSLNDLFFFLKTSTPKTDTTDFWRDNPSCAWNQTWLVCPCGG